MTESTLLKSVLLRYSRGATRLFRNSCGNFWQGRVIRHDPGSVTLANPRRIFCGLTEGASDAIGWRTVQITPEMVGQLVAVFVAMETKSPIGKASDEQMRFVLAVKAAGGIASVIRTETAADHLLLDRDP